jgi:hypothetical protein
MSILAIPRSNSAQHVQAVLAQAEGRLDAKKCLNVKFGCDGKLWALKECFCHPLTVTELHTPPCAIKSGFNVSHSVVLSLPVT